MDYHVRVGLENVPLHAWNMHTMLRVLGSSGSLDYIEPRSIKKESTDMLWAWVWIENPSRIPKVKRVTLPPRPSAVLVGGERGRRGLRHRVLVHIAIVEDFTSDNPPPPYELPFKFGEVDTAAAPRGRRGASSPRRDDWGRWRDNDDDRGNGRDDRIRERSRS
jgi:hypothetical protein